VCDQHPRSCLPAVRNGHGRQSSSQRQQSNGRPHSGNARHSTLSG
jgi:hypothetical protein